MEAMREETQAEEPHIGQERAHSAAHLGPLAVLQRHIRELLPTLPPAVALGHQAPVPASTSTCHLDLLRRMIVPIEG
jgi:hypothetical protein